MEQEPLFRSTIFKALTKPAMIMGVAYDYFYCASLAVMLVFIYSNNLLALLLFLPLHVLGWILTRIDPHIFRILSIQANIGKTRNYNLWRSQSYDCY